MLITERRNIIVLLCLSAVSDKNEVEKSWLCKGPTCEEMDGQGDAGAEAGLLKNRHRLR